MRDRRTVTRWDNGRARGWAHVKRRQGRNTRLYRAPATCLPVASGIIMASELPDRDIFCHVAEIVPIRLDRMPIGILCLCQVVETNPLLESVQC